MRQWRQPKCQGFGNLHLEGVEKWNISRSRMWGPDICVLKGATRACLNDNGKDGWVKVVREVKDTER